MIARSPLASSWSQPAERLRRWADAQPGADDAVGAARVFSVRQRLALLAGFALLVILRLPLAWVQGRFLGEEGSIFLAFAWHRPALEALLRSFGGYLNLAANGATLLAARLVRGGMLPLESAPYLTMVTALLFQLLPAALILTGQARWLANRWAVLAALLIVAISPMTEEVFLNVLHIQFHLALCTGLILALEAPSRRSARIGYWTVLFVAPLCGPGAIVLLPLFALQLFVFFTPSPVRGAFLDPGALAAVMVVRLAALPYLTSGLANVLGTLTYNSYITGGIGWWAMVAASITYFGALMAVALRDRHDPAIWLLLSGMAIGAASFGGGMIAVDPYQWFSVGAGERYNFLPLVLLTLALIVIAMRQDGRFRRISATLVMLTLITGAIGFTQPIKAMRNGPSWRAEVAAWRADHDHPLVLWPQEWTADLSDRARPCTGVAAADPAYCESVWLVQVAPHPRP
jgi:hypothetical protein